MIKKIRKMGIMIFVAVMLFTNWLLILAPVLTACLIGYYLLRKSASDEMDTKRWDNRIKIAIISCIGVVIASGLINIIIGYYR